MSEEKLLDTLRSFTPKVEGDLVQTAVVVCGGMGGSALPALALSPHVAAQLIIHRDYGLPRQLPEKALHIATSYSGNTEETLSFFDDAHAAGHPVAVIAAGGLLLERARAARIPYVEVPQGMEPRDAFVALSKALLALLGEDALLAAFDRTMDLDEATKEAAPLLAEALRDRIPLVYASTRNESIAYIAKITLNETSKVPAFSNVFPELNHNEMQGLDPLGRATTLFERFAVLLVRDDTDHERVRVRMDAFTALMKERGILVHELQVPAGSGVEALLWSWLLLRKATHLLAGTYGVPADETPLIAAFKKLL